ncbi:dTDP-glucose pyrophosphorylase [Herbaspirillum sp. Sphag1AN]|uniref:nucleotidyltransferase family protein n=1 Tax=unclassified Herbaspirillum TaxID=2624150 RepID=UPI00161305A6|nr:MULTISPECIES: nucleotidyltransferase family protein [unclassified Herbaspirillum]MBB3213008.1 dTDP-glucose pyrophosphorylase [Herbaspirillum sp. Sphag1AN]MBB3246205.1 dTDP-glucose pyrophosphorylase [Herbaspirillum sp. Sphag64]
MNKWKEVLVSQDVSIKDAIQMLDRSGMQIVLVVDGDGRLLGTVTDGDVRRGILKGLALSEPVGLIMNRHPNVEHFNAGYDTILNAMKRKGVHHMPLVDDDRIVVGLDTLDGLIQTSNKSNWVVLMAGGLGSRLRPLTQDCPKPMLKVGNKPLLETILTNFIDYGFRHFYISVNYMADMVKDYFGDGSRFGVEIRYLHEDERLGTAGALSLLPERPAEPFFVMNGDLLTKVNFNQMLDFHGKQNAVATMGVREYDYQIPYGVVNVESLRIVGIEEKPIQRFFVNAGIYVLDPNALDLIPQNTFLDMPTLFNTLIDRKDEAVVFPVIEYWMDVGHLADYEKANGEYHSVFS